MSQSVESEIVDAVAIRCRSTCRRSVEGSRAPADLFGDVERYEDEATASSTTRSPRRCSQERVFRSLIGFRCGGSRSGQDLDESSADHSARLSGRHLMPAGFEEILAFEGSDEPWRQAPAQR